MAYFDSSRFPTVAKFAALQPDEQQLVIRANRLHGLADAVETLDWLGPEECSDEQK